MSPEDSTTAPRRDGHSSRDGRSARDDADDTDGPARASRSELRRRTLLRQLGAGSALALGGIPAVAASDERGPDGRNDPGPPGNDGREPPGERGGSPPVEIPAGTREADASHLPEVASAVVEVHEDGSVSTRLRVDVDRLSRRRGRGDARRAGARPDAEPATRYSLGLSVASHDREHARALAEGRPDDAGLHAVVRRRGQSPGASENGGAGASGARSDGAAGAGGASGSGARSADESTVTEVGSVEVSSPDDDPYRRQTHRDGIGDPSTGIRDVAAFGQTESQECGPLARTTVRANEYETPYGRFLYDGAADRESADGAACAGHEWDATFEAFCEYLRWVPGYDCAVPSAFDTTWRVEATERTGTRAGTVFTCANFPAIPDTVVAAHDVALVDGETGPMVEFGASVGVVPEVDVRDYDFDANGITNLVVDGLAVAFPGLRSVYSYALATYLLQHDAGIVV